MRESRSIMDNCFFLLQEPYLVKGRVTVLQGLPVRYTRGYAPWASMINSSDLNVWFSTKFSGRDISTIL